MARPKLRNMPDLAALAQDGARIAVRVVPGAARDAVILAEAGLRITVTAAPEDGKANSAVRDLLARAMGVAPSDLTLVSGHKARAKVFAYAPGASRS